jgi:hypothetical protein
MPMDQEHRDFETFKEINASIRHWETLLLGTAKDFISYLGLAFSAAGAAVAWSNTTWNTRRIAVCLFMLVCIGLAGCAYNILTSQQGYLDRFYKRRREDIFKEMKLSEDKVQGDPSGTTVQRLRRLFLGAVIVAVGVLIGAIAIGNPMPGTLDGARLQGADLSRVTGLSQKDFDGACGDANTKVPAGIYLTTCP